MAIITTMCVMALERPLLVSIWFRISDINSLIQAALDLKGRCSRAIDCDALRRLKLDRREELSVAE